MILGRNAGLWAALVQAGLNMAGAALVILSGAPLTAGEVGLFAAANAFGLSVVGLVANSSDAGSLPTFAPTLTDRRSSGAVGSTVAASAGPRPAAALGRQGRLTWPPSTSSIAS